MPPTPPGLLAPARMLLGAVSPLTSRLVAGATRQATVLGAHDVALYLDVDGAVLPVLTRDAAALPTALRLAIVSGELALATGEPARVGWGVRAGDRVPIGDRALRLPRAEVRVVRAWRPARVRRRTTPDESLPGACDARREQVRARLADAMGAGPRWLVDPVSRAVVAADPTAPVAGLVGRGPGLTPSGDDAVAGALLVRHALGHDDPALWRAVRGRLGTTTAVSAALLSAAADGWATPEVVALVDAVAAADPAAVEISLPPVLSLGASSGRDLVAGVTAALDALVPSGRTAA
jgi:hypothetical protein